ncbi:MAG: CHAT domain-containing protein, partial [Acidobacteria bacterium]|nr:CHAT domain-containing protein [Acidobacteriota bacterium]
SACDTGLGKLRRGEGLMGMSRAFLYAGAPSLLASLWPVDDEATAQLMAAFYGYLARGLDKSRALQQAQADLRQGGRAHPFFWAPFILIGQPGAIPMPSPTSLLTGLLLGTLGLALIGLALRLCWRTLAQRRTRRLFPHHRTSRPAKPPALSFRP